MWRTVSVGGHFLSFYSAVVCVVGASDLNPDLSGLGHLLENHFHPSVF